MRRFKFRCALGVLLAGGLVALFWFLVLTASQRIQKTLLRFRTVDPRVQPVWDSSVWRLPSRFSNENASIPRILHQTFSSEMVYQKYIQSIGSCLSLNPGWIYYLWRDSEAEALISRHYPHFLKKYKGYRDNLERADSIRYIVLHHFGGIYLDMDVECRRPFLPALSRLPAFLDQERIEQSNIFWSAPFFAMNSAMGSVPGHPFFEFLIDAMLSHTQTGNAFHSTGPSLLTQKYKEYSQIENTRPVAIMDPRVFSPLMDTGKDWRKYCENKWNPTVANGCRMLSSKSWSLDDTDNTTLAIHRFMHLGYGFAVSFRGGSVNLTRIFPDRVKFYGRTRDKVHGQA